MENGCWWRQPPAMPNKVGKDKLKYMLWQVTVSKGIPISFSNQFYHRAKVTDPLHSDQPLGILLELGKIGMFRLSCCKCLTCRLCQHNGITHVSAIDVIFKWFRVFRESPRVQIRRHFQPRQPWTWSSFPMQLRWCLPFVRQRLSPLYRHVLSPPKRSCELKAVAEVS